MRDFGFFRQSCARFSSQLSLAVAGTFAVLAVGAAGCSRKEPQAADSVSVSAAALNATPQITDFAVYAHNSATLRDRATVLGGDVGVRLAGTGPFLISGYELALASEAQVETTHNVIANRVLLQDRARVGDVQASQITNQFGFYSHQYPFPSSMPAVPPTAPVSPGTTPLTVAASATTVVSPGSYGAVSVGYRGILRLRGGVYHLASVQLDNEARIEALAPVQLRVAGRFGALDRVWIGAASGVTLTAGDLRIEVSGHNGGSGLPTDTPKAAGFGNDSTIHGVMLVPNGTLQTGHRMAMVGAYVGRDVCIDIDSQVNYQSGVGPSGCLESCDDGNRCTTDTCSTGVCVHTPSAAGTSCADSNACNGTETCDGAGHCQAGTPVVCTPLDQCHAAGVCSTATGLCSNPAKSDGTSCNDGNACTKNDVCKTGACAGTGYTCNDGLACTADTCNGDGTCSFNVTAGNCLINGACYPSGAVNPTNQCQQCAPATSQTAWSPKTSGTSCNDNNACTKNDVCDGAGHCGGTAYTCNDGLACTVDSCNGDGTCTFTTLPEDCVINGACYVAGATNPSNQCQQCTPSSSQTAWRPKTNGTSCNDGNACTRSDICTAGFCGGTAYTCDDGLGCTVDTCNGDGTCTHTPTDGSCVIDGTCYVAGATNPTNPCQQCAPSSSQTNWSPKPNGTSCNDGNACTRTDTCQAGSCTGSNPVVCTASDQCHDAGTCDTGTGACSNPAKPDGTTCDDGNGETQGDLCTAGVCQGTKPCASIADVGAGATHTCAVRADGSLWCWGADWAGQLGNGTTADSRIPVRAGTATWNWASVAAGQYHSCAIRRDASLWCWGSNDQGQLGNGTTDGASTPVQVAGNDWAMVQAGRSHTCGVRTNGVLSCWGDNAHGGLGNGTQAGSMLPVEVAGTDWVRVATGDWHTCGIKADQTLWCWGANADGELGNDSTEDSPWPVQIGAANWSNVLVGVGAGGTHTCGVKLDGSLWCWGANAFGQIGIGSTAGSLTPVQVGSASWADIAGGTGHTCGIRGDGKLWCWGDNDSGQVGDGTLVNRLVPVRIPGQAWAGISGGAGHTCGRRQDGSLWCWGGNADGELGDGSVASQNSPEQIVGQLCSQVPICGNGQVEQGEECDDGNNLPGDGCSADCLRERCHGVVCTASDQCHDVGTCDASTGACSNPAKADGVACDDGNTCTQTDTCQAGSCTGGNPVVCTASDQCHDVGTCDASTGACSNPARADGTVCNDGNGCTQTDTCQAGSCTGSNPVMCAALDQCHDVGACNPTTGACSNPAKTNGSVCNDGNPCTRTDTCQAGTCTGANPIVCTPLDQCHAAGTCETLSGVCTNPTKPDGSGCDDGNACTRTDTCQAGTCTGVNPVVCTPLDQCHNVGTCNTTSGTCSNPAKANGVACNDSNACTRTDTCQAGTCTGANPIVCTPLDQCHEAGTCAWVSGLCSNPSKPDGTACNDGNLCTQTDTCVLGACVGGNPVVCGPGNQCLGPGTCDPPTGLCLCSGKANGTMCDDGSDSTSPDSCQSGACVGTPALTSPETANLADTLAYIYQGASPSQAGVAAGTIQHDRAAGIRGRILAGDGSPLDTVKVAIAGHPEFGATASRDDGGYDMVVNGGEILTVLMSKSGYLPVDRSVDVPCQGFGQVDDVVMTTADPKVPTGDPSQ